MEKKKYDTNDVAAGREVIGAFIGRVVYSHHLYQSVTTAAAREEQFGENTGSGRY